MASPRFHNNLLKVVSIAALSVMVFFRNDIGYRLLNSFHFLCMSAALAYIGIVAEPNFSAEHPPWLVVFAFLSFAIAMKQRRNRKKDLDRGVFYHSYYIGTSMFEYRWLPASWKKKRRIGRFIDPMFCVFLGYVFYSFSHPLGYWVIFASGCFADLEHKVHLREFNRSLDTLDGIVHSEVQSRTVERYVEAPKEAKQQQPDAGLPTGLAPDIQQNLNRRKTNKPPL